MLSKTPNHKWDYAHEKFIAAIDSEDGCDRNEKSCERCGVIKVTVIPPHGFPATNTEPSMAAIWCGRDGRSASGFCRRRRP